MRVYIQLRNAFPLLGSGGHTQKANLYKVITQAERKEQKKQTGQGGTISLGHSESECASSYI